MRPSGPAGGARVSWWGPPAPSVACGIRSAVRVSIQEWGRGAGRALTCLDAPCIPASAIGRIAQPGERSPYNPITEN